jgi:hypothetical protein
MPKRAEHSTSLSGDEKQQKAQPSPPPTGKREGDARDNDGRLKKNQEELGVGDDHKTEEMEQGQRGTFP